MNYRTGQRIALLGDVILVMGVIIFEIIGMMEKHRLFYQCYLLFTVFWIVIAAFKYGTREVKE